MSSHITKNFFTYSNHFTQTQERIKAACKSNLYYQIRLLLERKPGKRYSICKQANAALVKYNFQPLTFACVQCIYIKKTRHPFANRCGCYYYTHSGKGRRYFFKKNVHNMLFNIKFF